jgi:hypothetical protein
MIPSYDLGVFVVTNAANPNAQKAVAEIERALIERAMAGS